MQQSVARKRRHLVCEGWLLRTPNAWLMQLCRVLPASSRLALFRSCKQLARLVVHGASTIKLRFPAAVKQETYICGYWYQGSWERQQDQRRQRIIEALLQGCNNLEVEVDTERVRPYPSGLSSTITVWTEKQKRDWAWKGSNPAADGQRFHIMPNLQVIFLGNSTGLQDIQWLCDALKAGKLPQLHRLGVMYKDARHAHYASSVAYKETHAVMQRLAAAAGGQVTHLTTSCAQLLLELPQFTKLRLIAVYDTYLDGESAAQHLCQHPTIRTVTFGSSTDDGCSVSLGWDCSKLASNLETITVHNVEHTLLAMLPLAGLREFRFLHQAKAVHQYNNSKAALQLVLGCPSITVKCLPDPNAGTGVFHVHGWSEQHTQLITRIEGAHTIHFHAAHEQGTSLADAWAAVPQCIRHITWELPCHWETDIYDLEPLWQGWPEHVTAFSLSLGGFCNEAALLQVVKHAPVCVKTLTLLRNQSAYRGAFCNELYLAAPAHLKLVIKFWGMPPDSWP